MILESFEGGFKGGNFSEKLPSFFVPKLRAKKVEFWGRLSPFLLDLFYIPISDRKKQVLFLPFF